MPRSLSAALITEQKAVSNTPYIRVYVNATDYWDRLLFEEYHEESYRDYATIILRNDDLHFNNLDLTGKELDISHGHITGNNVAEPDGNGDTAEYSKTATLWVKNQLLHSVEGKLICELYCEGMWSYMREQRVMLVSTKSAAAPYYDTLYNGDTTIYAIIEDLIENADAMGWTLNPFAGTQDDIINNSDSNPVFNIDNQPYENAAAVLYRLIWMTKCYLRAKASKTLELVYPQTGDSADHTYYSDQAHYFKEYTEKVNLLIPNSIAVFCNQDADGGWDSLVTGTDKDQTEIDKYTEVLENFLVASITTQGEADKRAAAILTKIKSEQLSARLVIPHDAGVELYDKVEVLDERGV